jgi:hypothetical protein
MLVRGHIVFNIGVGKLTRWAAQRISIILHANQTVGNYWVG